MLVAIIIATTILTQMCQVLSVGQSEASLAQHDTATRGNLNEQKPQSEVLTNDGDQSVTLKRVRRDAEYFAKNGLTSQDDDNLISTNEDAQSNAGSVEEEQDVVETAIKLTQLCRGARLDWPPCNLFSYPWFDSKALLGGDADEELNVPMVSEDSPEPSTTDMTTGALPLDGSN